jgi:hypothetical protein
MNVGIGVGVGRTNEGLGVGPVGAADGAGEMAAVDPPVEPAGPTVGGRQPATAAARERTRVGPARRSIIG